MVFASDDVDLFVGLIKLPSEIISTIISYTLKCRLPELLYFPPIREIVATEILTNVYIRKRIFRHRDDLEVSYEGFDFCDCDHLDIKVNNLKQGIRQWNIFPKSISIDSEVELSDVVNTFPEILMDALSIKCYFDWKCNLDQENLLRLFSRFKIRLDNFHFSHSSYPFKIPPIATHISLHCSSLTDYAIPNVKKFNIHATSNVVRNQTFTFSPDLEDLEIYTDQSIQVIVPPNLRRLNIRTINGLTNLVFKEMSNLEYLLLQLPNIQSFDAAEIIAPNLQRLTLSSCEKLFNFDGLRKFQHLKELKIENSNYPMDLFNEGYFPELEKLLYCHCKFPELEDPNNSLLTFSPNLKELEISNYRFQKDMLGSLVFPPTLTVLRLDSLIFNYDYLGANLEYIHVRTSKITCKSDFRIPHMAQYFILDANYLILESLDFMYHLPTSLACLHLIAQELGKMNPATQLIAWPLKLRDFALENLKIDHYTLESLNLKHSRLEVIKIDKGNVKTLETDLFPVTVKDLTLKEMGIEKLPDSFENLENLCVLSFEGNQLREVDPVQLPMATLELLNVFNCNLRFISPFLVSMLNDKYKNVKLRVNACGNLNVSVIDIRRALKAIKGLSLYVTELDKTLIEISKHSSRLKCIPEYIDPLLKGSQTDDLYNGSEFSLDEESDSTVARKRRKTFPDFFTWGNGVNLG